MATPPPTREGAEEELQQGDGPAEGYHFLCVETWKSKSNALLELEEVKSPIHDIFAEQHQREDNPSPLLPSTHVGYLEGRYSAAELRVAQANTKVQRLLDTLKVEVNGLQNRKFEELREAGALISTPCNNGGPTAGPAGASGEGEGDC